VRTVVGRKQHRQPFYYRWWWRCLHRDCPTTLVMPGDVEDAIKWNVKPFPLEKYFRKPEPRSRDVALETLDKL
jgi:hypothetical protein